MSIVAYDEGKSTMAYELKFTNKDMQGVDTPHNDALVPTFNINTLDVKRVLSDPGISSEIMYHSLFEKLKLPAGQVRRAVCPVFSFSGEAIWPITIAEVPVHMELVQKNVEFILINIDLPYNAILRRGWFGKMKAVPTPYYQKLKFPSKARRCTLLL